MFLVNTSHAGVCQAALIRGTRYPKLIIGKRAGRKGNKIAMEGLTREFRRDWLCKLNTSSAYASSVPSVNEDFVDELDPSDRKVKSTSRARFIEGRETGGQVGSGRVLYGSC